MNPDRPTGSPDTNPPEPESLSAGEYVYPLDLAGLVLGVAHLVADLTGVDGTVLMTDCLESIGFGV
jgi:hypothetical protein